MKNKKIVLCVSGGIAAYKSIELLRLLKKAGAEVQVLGTKNSLRFIPKDVMSYLSGREALFDEFDNDDFSIIPHIEYAQNWDAIILAPASANVISKFHNNIADDLVTSTLIASNKPIFIAPAMNCTMYDNLSVSFGDRHFSRIGDMFDGNTYSYKNFTYIKPKRAMLACGYEGEGALQDPELIFEIVRRSFIKKDLKKQHFVVTAGSCREYIDPVRYITNPSTGKMGLALAEEIADRGGIVEFVAGNMDKSIIPVWKFKSVIHTVSAEDMYKAVDFYHTNQDKTLIMSAAVADYTVDMSDNKVKKKGDITLDLKRTKDILMETIFMGGYNYRIGFCAETEHVIENAKLKLAKKNLDFIVANKVSPDFNPFGNDMNNIKIVFKDSVCNTGKLSKKELATIIVDRYVEYRG